ncbi:Pyroglutamyl-peptidase 1 [Pseudocercospora fuligena]|uniref:Pyroglutamyl-peptidase 1 n=1 Tax=Pseudocercospora fuligena TaxID=685502 RepID=A0A8H6VC35_9PEZI|nr:Pyroglutamyl-peptidase 1 [Pseudocercospora fuligena]
MAPSVQLPNGNQEVLTNGHNEHAKEITILVTGFGPFQERYPVNPSYEIARRLPESLPARSPHNAVRIISYGIPIRVAYDEVRDLVPKLHQEYAGTVDVVLHIGMASGRKFYALERYGHRDGYDKNKDLDGRMPGADEGKTTFGDCPATMTTSLDYENVLLNWQVNLLSIPEGRPGNGAEARPSEDAGHYLCDYIYFNSLAHCGRRSGDMEGGGDKARPVLFLHVPAESDPDMIKKGTEVTIALIHAIVDNFCKRQVGREGIA